MIVCLCKAATDRDIDEAIDGGARSVDEVGEACGAGTSCGSCREYIHGQLEMSGAPCAGGCEDCPSRHLRVAS
jgi:bacterioferritin-associated ferredoxin